MFANSLVIILSRDMSVQDRIALAVGCFQVYRFLDLPYPFRYEYIRDYDGLVRSVGETKHQGVSAHDS